MRNQSHFWEHFRTISWKKLVSFDPNPKKEITRQFFLVKISSRFGRKNLSSNRERESPFYACIVVYNAFLESPKFNFEPPPHFYSSLFLSFSPEILLFLSLWARLGAEKLASYCVRGPKTARIDFRSPFLQFLGQKNAARLGQIARIDQSEPKNCKIGFSAPNQPAQILKIALIDFRKSVLAVFGPKRARKILLGLLGMLALPKLTSRAKSLQ